MSRPLKDYLPPVLLTTCEFPLLCQGEQPEFDALAAGVTEVLDAQFVTTAPLRGVERYEKIFGLVAKDTDTLDERRARILAKMNRSLPYTIRRLRQMLESLCGTDGYQVDLYHDVYRMVVSLLESVEGNQDAVAELLRGVVPANILWEIHIQSNHTTTLGIVCMMQTEDDILLEQEIPESDFRPAVYPAVWMDQYDNITIRSEMLYGELPYHTDGDRCRADRKMLG